MPEDRPRKIRPRLPGPDSPRPPKAKRRKRRLLLFGIPAVVLLLFVVAVELTSTSQVLLRLPLHEAVLQELEDLHPQGDRVQGLPLSAGDADHFFRAKMEGLVMVGRYWTKLYVKSKPWAEIQDESCLRPGCHDRRLLEGQVQFRRSPSTTRPTSKT